MFTAVSLLGNRLIYKAMTMRHHKKREICNIVAINEQFNYFSTVSNARRSFKINYFNDGIVYLLAPY
jgi:hypothetical protein